MLLVLCLPSVFQHIYQGWTCSCREKSSWDIVGLDLVCLKRQLPFRSIWIIPYYPLRKGFPRGQWRAFPFHWNGVQMFLWFIYNFPFHHDSILLLYFVPTIIKNGFLFAFFYCFNFEIQKIINKSLLGKMSKSNVYLFMYWYT